MELWTVLITFLLAVSHTVLAVPDGCDGYIDLVLAIDSSNSILESSLNDDPLNEWNLHKNFLKSIVKNLPVGTSTKVSAVRYSTQANVFFNFTKFENSINVQDAIWSMNYLGGNTNTYEAFRTINVDLMRHEYGERQDARDVLVILTDGLSNLNQHLTGQYARTLKNSGFEIYAVATSKEIDIAELTEIASEPVENYLFQVLSSSQLENIVDVLVHRICNVPDPTEKPPTENDCEVPGCLECEDPFTCTQCEDGKYFDGAWCRTCVKNCLVCGENGRCDSCEPGRYWDESTRSCEVCRVRADFVLLLDTSGSITDKNPDDNSYDNKELLKNFVKNLLDRIDTGPDKTRVAAIQFSNEARLEFRLDRFQSKEDMKNAITNMEFQNGETHTDRAIAMMLDEVLRPERGDRPDFLNIGLMITDGESTRSEQTLQEAARVHEQRVTMFVVGVTNQINEEELKELASDPDEQFYFNSTSIQSLDSIMNNLLIQVCGTPPENVPVRRKRDEQDHVGEIEIKNTGLYTKDKNSIIRQPYFEPHIQRENDAKDSSLENR